MFGRWMAEQGHALIYGGAQGGLMGAVSNAVLEIGGQVFGVLPAVESFQKRRHPGLTEYIETKDMAERKAKMIALADAFVALPGGPGTLDEISDVISLARLHLTDAPCVLFDMNGFYQPLKNVLEGMEKAGFAEPEDFEKVRDYIYQATGVESVCYRFPGGSSNTVSEIDMHDFIDYLDSQGVEYYDWNVDAGDGGGKRLSTAALLENCTDSIDSRETSIVLLHDSVEKPTTVEALPGIIENLLARPDTVILPITENTRPVHHIE